MSPFLQNLTTILGRYCSFDGPSNDHLLRYIRHIPGGAIYEILFNWSGSAISYDISERNILNAFNGPTLTGPEIATGNLEAYGTLIMQIGQIPTDYDETKCIQRRPVKKSSNLILYS